MTTNSFFTATGFRQYMMALPRPIQFFISLALVCLLVKGIRSGVGGDSSADRVAKAIGQGIQSVFVEDKGSRSMSLFSTTDMANADKSVEIREFGVGLLGTVLSGRAQRAGGSLYFNQYSDGALRINGGPIDLQIPNGKTTVRGIQKDKLFVDGYIRIEGQEAPIRVQLIYWYTKEEVGLITGAVTINGHEHELKSDDYKLFYPR